MPSPWRTVKGTAGATREELRSDLSELVCAEARRQLLVLQRLWTLCGFVQSRGGLFAGVGPWGRHCDEACEDGVPVSVFSTPEAAALTTTTGYSFQLSPLSAAWTKEGQIIGVLSNLAWNAASTSPWIAAARELSVRDTRGREVSRQALLQLLSDCNLNVWLDSLGDGPAFSWDGVVPVDAPRTLRKERVLAVRSSWSTKTGWVEMSRTAWRLDEHNNIGELRMVVNAVRHFPRRSPGRRARVMVITDSLVSLGAVCKGRSSVYALNRLLRQLGAICLLHQIKVYARFANSEDNNADGPSRGFSIGQAPKGLAAAEAKERIRKHLTKKAMTMRRMFARIRAPKP